MTRILLTLAAVALTSAVADAGPLRNLACRVAHRVQARPHVRQSACDVRNVAQRVASVPARVAEAQPVRTAVANVAYTVGRVCGPNGCR